jgi:hypothetical protein
MKTVVSFIVSAFVAAFLLGPAPSALANGAPVYQVFLPVIFAPIPRLEAEPPIPLCDVGGVVMHCTPPPVLDPGTPVPLCDYGTYVAHCTHTPEPPTP